MYAPGSGMQLHVKTFAWILAPAILAAAPIRTDSGVPLAIPGYAVLADDAGAWPQILSSIGFPAQPAGTAGILVLRPGSAPMPRLTERVDEGAFLILEGQSDAAAMFGFQAGKDRIAVGSVEDLHRPKLPIIWQKPVELARFAVPKQARIFAKERWTGAPLIAGYVSGRGAVLWVATSPGERGYEKFPYILQALNDL